MFTTHITLYSSNPRCPQLRAFADLLERRELKERRDVVVHLEPLEKLPGITQAHRPQPKGAQADA